MNSKQIRERADELEAKAKNAVLQDQADVLLQSAARLRRKAAALEKQQAQEFERWLTAKRRAWLEAGGTMATFDRDKLRAEYMQERSSELQARREQASRSLTRHLLNG